MNQNVYLVATGANPPVTVEPVSFNSLGVQERRDLEDWVLKNPQLLGEELLIITPEFDRFDKSNRRLDVLALDKDGVLVVIELKLDVAGTLADLQAIRYAAFCSTMTMDQVIDYFANYHVVPRAEAETHILKFLKRELPQLENQPRIILAAGSMDDKELTSCVLWLRNFGLDLKCVELTPYRLPDSSRVLLVPRVIIPLPQAHQYIVSVEKQKAAQNQEQLEKRSCSHFWAMVSEEFNRLNPMLPTTRIPSASYFQVKVDGKRIHYEWILQKQKSQVGVELHFESDDRIENLRRLKQIIDIENEIRKGIDLPFHAEPWRRDWAALGFEVPYEGEPDCNTATQCAELMKTLIDRTLPTVHKMIDESAISS